MSMITPYITSAFKSLGSLGVPMKETEKEVVGGRGRRRARLGRVEGWVIVRKGSVGARWQA